MWKQLHNSSHLALLVAAERKRSVGRTEAFNAGEVPQQPEITQR